MGGRGGGETCTAAARYRLHVALLRLTALCRGIKGDQHLEGKIKIGQTAQEERLALARGSDNERASSAHLHGRTSLPPPPAFPVCLIQGTAAIQPIYASAGLKRENTNY